MPTPTGVPVALAAVYSFFNWISADLPGPRGIFPICPKRSPMLVAFDIATITLQREYLANSTGVP